MIVPAADDAPAEPPPSPRPEWRRDTRSEPTVPEPDRPRTRGGRSILLIDDQADLVQVVRTILEGRGYSVDAALNGRDGVKLAEASRYSLVLTDLGMPDISGWEVADRVRECQPETPVILMTGWAADIPRERLHDHSIASLLPKPFRSDQLLTMIKQTLDR
jgi:CheY-like chemotaxis protein